MQKRTLLLGVWGTLDRTQRGTALAILVWCCLLVWWYLPVVYAQTGGSIPAPATPPTQTFDQLTTGGAIALIIQLLKNWRGLKWINSETPRLNRFLQIALSGFGALGVHAHWTYSASGTFSLVVQGLTLTSILTGAWAWMQTFAGSHLWFLLYKAAKNGASAPPAPSRPA